MKLSKETLGIFKNFSNINSNLTLKPGNRLATVSTGKNLMAQAEVQEEFPINFGIYDLNEFLGALSLFDSPELDFSEKYVTVTEGKNSVRYFAASSSILTPVPPVKPLPAPDIEFDLTGQMLGQIQRVASILRVSDFSLVGNGETILACVGDKTNPTGNSFESEIGSTDKNFRVNLKVENMKMLPSDYRVSIAAKKLCKFQSVSQSLLYLVAIELDSSFDF